MRIPFLNRFRRMAANASDLVSSRLSMFGQELQEELARRTGHLVLLLALFMFGTCALLLAAVVILTLAWQHGHLVAAAACLTAIYALCTIACVLCLRHKLHTAPPPFAATLAEFRKDEAALRGDAATNANSQIQQDLK